MNIYFTEDRQKPKVFFKEKGLFLYILLSSLFINISPSRCFTFKITKIYQALKMAGFVTLDNYLRRSK